MIRKSRLLGPGDLIGALLIGAPLVIFCCLTIDPGPGLYPHQNFSGEVRDHLALKDPQKFRLAVASDLHNNVKALEEVMDEAAGIDDALLLLGDVRHRGIAVEYRLFRGAVEHGKRGLPVYSIMGNHDLDFMGRDGDGFRNFFGTDRFYWRFGRNFFIALNNVEEDRWEEQLEWLGQVLDHDYREGDNVFVFLHKPPMPKSNAKGLLRLPELIVNLQQRKEKVRVFAGHLHMEKEHLFMGVPILVLGNLGDFDGSDPPGSISYLDFECSPDQCVIAARKLADNPNEKPLAYAFFVDAYWGWPILSFLFFCSIVTFKWRRHSSARIDPAPPGR